MRRPLLILSVLVLFAAACGDDSGSSATNSSEPTSSTAPTTADDASTDQPTTTEQPSKEAVTVVLVTYDSFAVTEDLLTAFEADTGITIDQLTAGDAGEMLNQLILTKDNPIGDVVWGVDNTLLSKALAEDLFVPYDSPKLAEIPDELELDPENRLLPVDRGDVCLNYDVAYFADNGLDVPQTLEALTDPAYKDLLVVPNPATSSPGLAFLLATIAEFGEDGWQDYWQKLADNGIVVQPGWSEAYYGDFTVGGGGDRPLVVSYASSPPVEVIFADPPRDDAPTGVIDASCFRQIEFTGIVNGADDVEAAQQVVDFLLSQELQEDIPLNMFVFPANEKAALPPEFVEFTSVPANPLDVDADSIDQNREAWIQEWTDIVVN